MVVVVVICQVCLWQLLAFSVTSFTFFIIMISCGGGGEGPPQPFFFFCCFELGFLPSRDCSVRALSLLLLLLVRLVPT